MSDETRKVIQTITAEDLAAAAHRSETVVVLHIAWSMLPDWTLGELMSAAAFDVSQDRDPSNVPDDELVNAALGIAIEASRARALPEVPS